MQGRGWKFFIFFTIGGKEMRMGRERGIHEVNLYSGSHSLPVAVIIRDENFSNTERSPCGPCLTAVPHGSRAQGPVLSQDFKVGAIGEL